MPKFSSRCIVWSFFLHESAGGNGLSLRDLANHTADPKGSMSAVKLLFRRFQKHGSNRRVVQGYVHVDFMRKLLLMKSHHRSMRWSMVLVVFLLLIGISGFLTFTFGRVVNIDARIVRDYSVFDEVPVFGDLSTEDLQNAQQNFNSSNSTNVRLYSLLLITRD